MRSSPEPGPAPVPVPETEVPRGTVSLWAFPELADKGGSAGLSAGIAGAGGAGGAWILPDLGSPTGREASGADSTPAPDASYDHGYEDGVRDGAAAAEREIRAAIEAVRHISDSLSIARNELAGDHARGIYALATAVAKKLIQREIELDPAAMQGLIERATELMPPDAPFTARLNPSDLEAITPFLESMNAQGRVSAVEWLADPAIERGGFRLENPLRVVDGRIDVALRNLYESLDHEWDRHA